MHVPQLAVFDHPRDPELKAVVMLTEPAQDRVMRAVVDRFEQLPTVMGGVKTIRMESLG